MYASIERSEGLHECDVTTVSLDESGTIWNVLSTTAYEVVERDHLMTLVEQEFCGR